MKPARTSVSKGLRGNGRKESSWSEYDKESGTEKITSSAKSNGGSKQVAAKPAVKESRVASVSSSQMKGDRKISKDKAPTAPNVSESSSGSSTSEEDQTSSKKGSKEEGKPIVKKISNKPSATLNESESSSGSSCSEEGTTARKKASKLERKVKNTPNSKVADSPHVKNDVSPNKVDGDESSFSNSQSRLPVSPFKKSTAVKVDTGSENDSSSTSERTSRKGTPKLLADNGVRDQLKKSSQNCLFDRKTMFKSTVNSNDASSSSESDDGQTSKETTSEWIPLKDVNESSSQSNMMKPSIKDSKTDVMTPPSKSHKHTKPITPSQEVEQLFSDSDSSDNEETSIPATVGLMSRIAKPIHTDLAGKKHKAKAVAVNAKTTYPNLFKRM